MDDAATADEPEMSDSDAPADDAAMPGQAEPSEEPTEAATPAAEPAEKEKPSADAGPAPPLPGGRRTKNPADQSRSESGQQQSRRSGQTPFADRSHGADSGADSARLRDALEAARHCRSLAGRRIPLGRRRKVSGDRRRESRHQGAGSGRHCRPLRHDRRPHHRRAEQPGGDLFPPLRHRAANHLGHGQPSRRRPGPGRSPDRTERDRGKTAGLHRPATGAAGRRDRHQTTQHRERAADSAATLQSPAGGRDVGSADAVRGLGNRPHRHVRAIGTSRGPSAHVEAAVAWTADQAVQVIIDRQFASVETGDQRRKPPSWSKRPTIPGCG